jgi:hypothetical protein
MTSSNGNKPGALRAGTATVLGLEQDSGVGFHFDPLEAMAHMSREPQQWMCLTDMSEREIQIQSMRFARRHRARYGNSRLDLVDYFKALMRVSRDGRGRTEIKEMQIAESNRASDEKSGWGRAFGHKPTDEANKMKLNG